MNRMLIFLFFIFTSIHSQAQNVSVSGKITSSRIAVSDALITFIYNTDTTTQFSAVTDQFGNYQIGVVTSINSAKNNLPSKFKLGHNYPNPFSSTTSIPYGLDKESDVNVTIYDILGREVRKYEIGKQNIGTHNISWDGRNNFGHKVVNGIYFYKFIVDSEAKVGKMIFNSLGINSINLPHNSSFTFNEKLSKENYQQNKLAGNFTIRISNTDRTTPFVIEQEINDVLIQRDTTISISVSTIPVAEMNMDSTKQLIRGFGAANILQWRPDMTNSEIETAFGTGDGQLGFSILRLRLQPDSNQWSTNLATAKKAYDMGVDIFASPWSPPASMKTNNSLVGGELKESSYSEYEYHLKSFVDFMSNNGVPIYGVSIQNEPDIEVSYESCDWSPQQMVKFIGENTSSIGTRIIAPESFQFRREMSDPILNDSLACANLDIVGGHIYGGGLASYPLAEEKGKEIWMTEHLTESSHSANIWSLALEVGEEIQQVMEANMNAYIWWYIVRYYGPIGDGETSTSFPNEDFANKGDVTKKGYVMSQFARFIRPDFFRVDSDVIPSKSTISVTAYKDTTTLKRVIVAVNPDNMEREIVFRIQNGEMITSLTPYITSEDKNCEEGENIIISNSNIILKLEPSSITTFISN